MPRRFWRDLVASSDHGLWRGAIPQPPTSPQGVKENFLFDLVMRLAETEEDEEKLGELLVKVARQGRLERTSEPVAPPATSEKLLGSDENEKPRGGRRPNESADDELLAEIRAQNPKSDGRKKFIDFLTLPYPKGRDLKPETARRRYVKAAARLEK